MHNIIIYRPYKTQIWPVLFTIPAGIFAFVASGYCLPLSRISVLCLVGIGIACICLTKVLYDSANKAVFFEEKGLRIIGSCYVNYQYIPWEELAYAYYTRNYKGHLFLVLSPKMLSLKEAKHFANRGAILSQIYINYVVVLYIDILQDVSNLRRLIDEHIAHIDTY